LSRFSFLHLADLHLDSPLRGLEADADAPAAQLREATRAAFRNAVDDALEERVALVLIAGDLFDGDWPDWRSGAFLTAQLARLTQAGIRVIGLRGNHDAESVITRKLVLPEGATVLRADRPETVDLPEIGAAVHGQSFATREVLTDLSATYPPPLPGRCNIGLLHTAATGRDGHANYAPCSVEALASHGYDYWALGHVHEREVLSEAPWIVFPGNPQGRHAKETGPKGGTLVTVEDGRVRSVQPRIFDVVRWAHPRVDLSGAADEEAVWEAVRLAIAVAAREAEGRLLALRLTLAGATPCHAALCRDPGATRDRVRAEAIAAAGTDAVWLEALRLETRPALDRAGLRTDPGALGALVRSIEAADKAVLGEALRDYAAAMLNRNPGARLREALGPDHPAVRAAAGEVTPEFLLQARELLLARLAEASE
jgi:DNA repair protein SbcD/Mre11